ncbi:unnamed protein product [Phaedon cochleariae]|uniref:Uncharacterized protein n=1 Tax=Phaedon cochleariae TaxID=80249 RepID=A0A9N9SCU0_PHACE|nr:unnamed protein product [Phaedon cochleariae]
MCCNKKPKSGYYICVKCHGVFHISCYDRIAPKTLKNTNKLVCKECENSDIAKDNSVDEFYSKLIEELRIEGKQKEETIVKINKKYELFYDEAITMENEFMSQIQTYKKVIRELQENLLILKREVANKKSEVVISTQTQTDKEDIEQKMFIAQVPNDSDDFNQMTEYDDNTMLPSRTNYLENPSNEKIHYEPKSDRMKKKQKSKKQMASRRKIQKEEIQMILRSSIKRQQNQQTDTEVEINSVVTEEREAVSTVNSSDTFANDSQKRALLEFILSKPTGSADAQLSGKEINTWTDLKEILVKLQADKKHLTQLMEELSTFEQDITE